MAGGNRDGFISEPFARRSSLSVAADFFYRLGGRMGATPADRSGLSRNSPARDFDDSCGGASRLCDTHRLADVVDDWSCSGSGLNGSRAARFSGVLRAWRFGKRGARWRCSAERQGGIPLALLAPPSGRRRLPVVGRCAAERFQDDGGFYWGSMLSSIQAAASSVSPMGTGFFGSIDFCARM